MEYQPKQNSNNKKQCLTTILMFVIAVNRQSFGHFPNDLRWSHPGLAKVTHTQSRQSTSVKIITNLHRCNAPPSGTQYPRVYNAEHSFSKTKSCYFFKCPIHFNHVYLYFISRYLSSGDCSWFQRKNSSGIKRKLSRLQWKVHIESYGHTWRVLVSGFRAKFWPTPTSAWIPFQSIDI